MPELTSDRRQLLRAGAWTVPVVAVAAAAPAFAGSTQADLATSTRSVSTTGNGNSRVSRITVSIVNTGGVTTSLLTARIKFNRAAPAGQVAPANWSIAVDPLDPEVLVYTSTAQVAGNGGSLDVVFTIEPGNSGTTGVLSLQPGNGTGRTFTSTEL